MECWQDVPDLGDPIAESLGDPTMNGSGATPAPTILLGFQSWGCHLAGSGDPPPAGRRQYLLGSWDAPGSGFWLLLGLLKDFMGLALWTFKNYGIP